MKLMKLHKFFFKIGLQLKTFQVESLFLWAFVLVLVRRMTAAAAAATAAVTTFAMYWEDFTLAMCLVLESGCTE